MPPRSWNPTTVVLWILLGLLLCPEPGTGRSEGRGLLQGQSILQKGTALPSVSSHVQGKTGVLRRPPVSRNLLQSGDTDSPSPTGSRPGVGPDEQKSGRLPGGGDTELGQEGDFYLGRSRKGHCRQREEQRNHSVECLEKNQNSWVNSPASATSYLCDLRQVT